MNRSEGGKDHAAATHDASRRGRWLSTLLLTIFLVVGLSAGAVYYWYSQARVKTDNAYVHATTYPISPRIQGTVLEVLVEDNQSVRPNELLVRLDPQPPSLQVRMAKAAYEAARTAYEEAKTGLKAAEAERALVEAKLGQARLDLGRAEALWKKRSIPKERYDRALTQFHVVEAQRQVSLAKIEAARARIASSKTNLEHAEARLAHAELILSYTEIRSPGKGYVSQKSVEPGQVVQPGFPLMAVVDLGDLWVEANYKEVQVRRIRPGQRAEVRVDVYPHHVFPAHVESIHAGTGAAFSLFPPENATGNWVKVVQRIPVKLLLDDYVPGLNTPILRVGMSAEVSVRLEERPRLPWPLSILAAR